jgi:translation initiation factor 3 subunit G
MHSRPDWADDVSESEQIDPSALPPPVTTVNKDGTKTTISYRLDDQGRKIKVTRKTRTTVHKERVNPIVAERREWSKFGLEKGKPKGPQPDTTSVGENIVFRPSRDWKNVQAEEAKAGGGKAEEKSLKEQLKDKKVKCRICQGEHFTARCPFKDTMAPADDGATPVADPMGADEDGAGNAAGGLGVGGSNYVPPHMRKGAAGAGERMGGKFERDDLATLRVTNVRNLPTLETFHRHADEYISRYLKWLRSRNSATSSNDSAASRVCSLRKTEIRVGRRVLHLFHSLIDRMLQEHARRWMASVIDI